MLKNCSSAIAPALPYYLPSMAVSAIAPRQPLLGNHSSATTPRQLLLHCPTTVRPVHMHCPTTVRPVHMHCPNTTAMDGGSADFAGANVCPYVLYICVVLVPYIPAHMHFPHLLRPCGSAEKNISPGVDIHWRCCQPIQFRHVSRHAHHF